MDLYNVMQDSEIEFFGMDADWRVEKEREWVYDQLHDIDPVSDLINTSDFTLSAFSAGQPVSMQHSSSLPLVHNPSSPTWTASSVNELFGHSVTNMHNASTNPMDHLNPVWAVPSLQSSSYDSSAGVETYFNELDGNHLVLGAISPSLELDRSPLLLSHDGRQYWSGETAVSRTESNASSDLTYEERFEPANERSGLLSNPLQSSSLPIVQSQISRRTKRQATAVNPRKKNPRGRKGPLQPDNRKTAHEMRNVGACKACRDRKTKCDKGLPCRSCINYYKCALIHNPCRGRQLEDLASEILLCGNIFPKDRGLFGLNLNKDSSIFTVYLEVGFGSAFAWPAQLLTTPHGGIFPTELRHSHVVYKWMMRENETVDRVLEDHWVFPAVLLDTSSNLVDAVEKHIESLLEDRTSFQLFPLFRSPLQVLKTIYPYYKQGLDNPQSKQLLRQVLKLLITVHICGDIKISPSASSQAIIDTLFPTVHHSQITPCFIRSQLGPIFAQLASKLLKEVLTSLEFHCLDKEKTTAHFPLVISTFAVLFMSVESIHYHAARDPYHATQHHSIGIRDCTSALTTTTTATPAAFEKTTGVQHLLSFYRTCFEKCHSLRLSPRADTDPATVPIPVVENLRLAVESARGYLEMRGSGDGEVEGDVTLFFDRLLAKLFLLGEGA